MSFTTKLLLLGLLGFISCEMAREKPSPDALRSEIRKVEREFAQMVSERGMAEAFVHFAAGDAVLNRNDSLIRGREGIRNFFSGRPRSEHEQLTWEPEFIDVATSGDLAYTYGPYTYANRDTSGQLYESKGIFHTVWKRQTDGSWRYVWD